MSISDVKDIVLAISGLVVPIVVAWINIRQNKKTRNDIDNELYKMRNENILKQYKKYNKNAGIKRLGNVSDGEILANNILLYLERHPNLKVEELKSIQNKIDRIKLPDDQKELYPCEIMPLLKIEEVKRKIQDRIDAL